MTTDLPAWFNCTFCKRDIEVARTRSWSQAISFVAKHVSECDAVPVTATSAQRTTAINEMVKSVIQNDQ
jgi:hypothetical protein